MSGNCNNHSYPLTQKQKKNIVEENIFEVKGDITYIRSIFDYLSWDDIKTPTNRYSLSPRSIKH